MEPITVALRSRRRARVLAVQKAQHAVPALGLITAGVTALRSGARGLDLALAVVEVLTSVLLIRALVLSFRTARAHGQSGMHHAHRVDWAEVWAAGVLFAEAAERWHAGHHFARPTLLTAVVTLALGLFHSRLEAFGARRRTLRVDDAGVYVGGQPFRAFRAPWADVADISVAGRMAEIRTRRGRVRRLDLGDLEDAESVRGALEAAQSRLRSLPMEAPPELTGVKA